MRKQTIARAVLAPVKWVYNSYPKRYMGLGNTYGPGAISNDTAEHYTSVENNKGFSRKHIEKAYKKIPKNLEKARRRYLGNMRRMGMDDYDRVDEYKWGQFIQFASMLFFTCMFIHAQLNIFIANTGGDYFLIINNGINSTILLLTAIISSVGYFVGTWKSFSARNMMQLNPFQVFWMLIKHPSEILPTQDFEDSLETSYGYKIGGNKNG